MLQILALYDENVWDLKLHKCEYSITLTHTTTVCNCVRKKDINLSPLHHASSSGQQKQKLFFSFTSYFGIYIRVGNKGNLGFRINFVCKQAYSLENIQANLDFRNCDS